MKLRPLILDDLTRKEIKRVMDHAEVHRLGVHDLFAIQGGRRNPPGDDPGFKCVLPFGYRCVYTIEQQPKHGWCRHLSVSVLGDGAAPNEHVVLELMKEFGFKGGFKDLLGMSQEDMPHGKVAINVIQKL